MCGVLHVIVTACEIFEIPSEVCLDVGEKETCEQVYLPSVKLVGTFFFGFLQDSISLLLEAVRTRNEELAQTWKKSEQWATIEQLCSKCLTLPQSPLPGPKLLPFRAPVLLPGPWTPDPRCLLTASWAMEQADLCWGSQMFSSL